MFLCVYRTAPSMERRTQFSWILMWIARCLHQVQVWAILRKGLKINSKVSIIADDALAVGVMLDCIRVLINTPDWQPTHSIIFCTYCDLDDMYHLHLPCLVFNNAEESLQDGSHLYSNEHETASAVRAVINLEGTKYYHPTASHIPDIVHSRWYYRTRVTLPSDLGTNDSSLLQGPETVWNYSC